MFYHFHLSSFASKRKSDKKTGVTSSDYLQQAM